MPLSNYALFEACFVNLASHQWRHGWSTRGHQAHNAEVSPQTLMGRQNGHLGVR